MGEPSLPTEQRPYRYDARCGGRTVEGAGPIWAFNRRQAANIARGQLTGTGYHLVTTWEAQTSTEDGVVRVLQERAR